MSVNIGDIIRFFLLEKNSGDWFQLSVLSSGRPSDNMIRTQISLDEKEYPLAKKSAREQGISVAEYVRRAIRKTLSSSSDADPSRCDPSPWMRYAGIVPGDSDSSQSIDDVIYGSQK
jgi:hypothetical protein